MLAGKIKHHILNIVGVFVFLAVYEGKWEQTDLICFSDLGKFMPCVLNYLKHFQGRASCVAGSVGTVASPCPPLVIKGMGQTSGTLFWLNTCWCVVVFRAPLPHLTERKSSIYKGMMRSSLYLQCLIRIWEVKAYGSPRNLWRQSYNLSILLVGIFCCLLMVFILALSVARWSSRGQVVQRLGQELICEEWAWQDQLLEGKF